MKKTLFIGIALSLISCTAVLKTAYGITNPKLENKETLNKYIASIDLKKENSLVVNDKKNYKEVMADFQRSVPEAILFDREGNQLTYKEKNESCNAGLFATIPQLTANSTLEKTNGKNLKEFSSQLIDLNTKEAISNFPKADYYLFLNWAKFMGKLNKDHVKVWEDLAANNTNVKIAVYKVNMDFQDNWGLKEGDIKMSSK